MSRPTPTPRMGGFAPLLRAAGTILLVAGALAVPVGAAMPWLRTGSVRRSAFALARSARNLGLVEGPFRRVAFLALVVAPALAGVVLIAVSFGRRRLGALVGLVIALIGVSGSIAGRRLPGNPEAGVFVSLLSGLTTGVGSLVTLAMRSPAAQRPPGYPRKGRHDHERAHEPAPARP